MRKKMYFEMLVFALIFIAGSFTFALISKELHRWLLDRKVCKLLQEIQQRKEDHYAVMARDAVKEAEAFLREMRKRP